MGVNTAPPFQLMRMTTADGLICKSIVRDRCGNIYTVSHRLFPFTFHSISLVHYIYISLVHVFNDCLVHIYKTSVPIRITIDF